MEKNEAISVDNVGGVFGQIAIENGLNGGTQTEREATIGGEREKKEAVVFKNDGGSEMKEASSIGKMKKKAGAGVGQKQRTLPADDQTTVVVTKGCRLQVSNTKKPLFFYLNVAKRYIKQNNYVELSGLGMAIPTVVTIAEILKKDGWAIEKDISISTVTLKDDVNGRVIMKAKIGILMEKPKNVVKLKVVPDKNSSEIGVDVAKEYSFDINTNNFEKKDQVETNGTFGEKNVTQRTIMTLTDGEESTGSNQILSEKNDTCGINEKIVQKENTVAVLAADG